MGARALAWAKQESERLAAWHQLLFVPTPRLPCLWFESSNGARIAFGLLAPDGLVEGRLTVAARDELRFDGFHGRRAFRR